VKLGGTVEKIYPFHRWELGRTVEILWKNTKKEGITKEQHITQSLLS
jgi:hypothetical protein